MVLAHNATLERKELMGWGLEDVQDAVYQEVVQEAVASLYG